MPEHAVIVAEHTGIALVSENDVTMASESGAIGCDGGVAPAAEYDGAFASQHDSVAVRDGLLQAAVGAEPCVSTAGLLTSTVGLLQVVAFSNNISLEVRSDCLVCLEQTPQALSPMRTPHSPAKIAAQPRARPDMSPVTKMAPYDTPDLTTQANSKKRGIESQLDANCESKRVKPMPSSPGKSAQYNVTSEIDDPFADDFGDSDALMAMVDC